MIVCPTCNERAEHKVYRNDSSSFPAGPAIRVCHASEGAYIHVDEEEEEG